MKKKLSILLACAMLMSCITPAFAENVNPIAENQEVIEKTAESEDLQPQNNETEKSDAFEPTESTEQNSDGEIKAILCLITLILVCLVAARVIIIPRLSAEEKQNLKEHSLREELSELEAEACEQGDAAAAAPEEPGGETVCESEETNDEA